MPQLKKTESGKLVGQIREAKTVVKYNKHSIELFYSSILVEIPRVRPLEAMVACRTRSFIREEILKDYTLKIKDPSKGWIGVRGGSINVTGEVDLLARFCKIPCVSLKNRVIARYLTYNLILGSDWMEAAGIDSFPEGGVMKLNSAELGTPPLSAQLPSMSIMNVSPKVTDESILLKTETRDHVFRMESFADILSQDDLLNVNTDENGISSQQINQKEKPYGAGKSFKL